ncbi:hypothetical protein Slin14017_G122940 [Septoria linicola]|nr:hypothetical protein Slin14017_G122940 [Septoria linicola]
MSRQPQTPNLFLNTSLEEPEHSRPQPSIDSIIRNADRNIARAMNQIDEVRQRMTTSDEAATSRRAERADQQLAALQQHREKETSTLGIFKFTLHQWKEYDLEGLAKFMSHFRNAAQAADHSVRIFDIASWYSDLPGAVSMALRDVQKYYHSETSLQNELRHLEEKTPSWSSRQTLSHEIRSAVDLDAKYTGPAYISPFCAFGLCNKKDEIVLFDDRFHAERQEEQRLASIYANFKVRCTMMGAKVTPRPHYNEGTMQKFKYTLECSMVKWSREALDVLQSMAKNPRLTSRLKQCANKIVQEIRAYLPKVDTIGLCHMLDIVEQHFIPMVHAAKNDMWVEFAGRVATEPSNTQANALATRFSLLRDAFGDYEVKHGRQVLGTEWKKMVFSVNYREL